MSVVYPGIFRGEVVDNDDSKTGSPHLGRIKVRVPQIYGDIDDVDLPWAIPCFPYAGRKEDDYDIITQEFFGLPGIDSTVWVMFEAGDPKSPVWMGSWYGERKAQFSPPELNEHVIRDAETGVRYPDIYMFKNPAFSDGMWVRFLGTKKAELVFHKGKNGLGRTAIELDGVNKRIKIEADPASGWSIVLEGANIEINATEGVEIAGKTVTLSASETLTLASQGEATLSGEDVARVTSKKAILGFSPKADGFEQH